MKNHILATIILASFAATSHGALVVPLVFDGTGGDFLGGQHDGTFDTFDTNGFQLDVGGGSIQEYRSALEFNISSLLSGPGVLSATLTLQGTGWSQNPPATSIAVRVHGYAGDGNATVSDLLTSNPISTAFLYTTSDIQTDLTVDVTSFLQSLIAGNDSYAGFTIRADDLSAPGDFIPDFRSSENVSAAGHHAPTLTVTVPEPVTPLFVAIGLFALIFRRARTQRSA